MRRFTHTFPQRISAFLLCLALLVGLLSITALAAAKVSYIEYSWNESTSTLTSTTKSVSDYTVIDTNITTWDSSTPGDWYLAQGDVTIDQRVTVTGDVHLILADGCTLTVNGGIRVAQGNSLTIYGQSGDSGQLIAQNPGTYNAGIGGNMGQTAGTVTIHGGTVTANGGSAGAGIGGGFNGSGGTVTINGGTVTANGGAPGAGIGGGLYRSGGTVTIKGGTVTATGNGGGAGIGGGSTGSGGAVTIKGGTVTATAYGGGAGIGDGSTGSGGAVTIDGNTVVYASAEIFTEAIGGTSNISQGIVFQKNVGQVYGDVTLQEDLEIGEGESLTLDHGASLDANGHNVIVDGGTLDSTLATNLGESVIYKVTKVELNKTSLTLQETGSDTLTVTVEPDNATNKNVNWESSDTSIATVDASGKVTAISAGSATITVAAADGSGVSASCSVTVTHGNMVHTPKKDATCTAEGNKEYWTCGTCGKIFSDAEGKTEIELSATVIPATGHNLTKTEGKAPTCTAEGNTEYWTCGACRKHFSDEEGKTEIELSSTVIPAVGHSFSGGTCTVCGAPDPNYTPPYIPPTYAVTVPETTGGTVEVSPSRASSGRRVTITATPDLGYELESLTVLDSRGSEIALTDQGDGKYTFTMPSRKVTVQASFAPAPLPFEDVPPGAWYEDAVRYAYTHGIMEGMSATKFSPNISLTRAQAVQVLYNLEGQPTVSESTTFPDLVYQWYKPAISWAEQTGVVDGYEDGTFHPDQPVTRQEFAQMLYDYAAYKDYDLTAEGDLSAFPDGDQVQKWALPAMTWANGNALINGHDDGTLEPGGTTTRAQAASILMRFDQNLAE